MKAWFQRFMSGRNGSDQFSGFLGIVSVVLVLLGSMMGQKYGILFWLGVATIIYCYYRILSRNIQKRYAENLKYLACLGAVQGYLSTRMLRFKQRKQYRYFRCPHCGQEVRVPTGRGKISITCPKCDTHFIKKS